MTTMKRMLALALAMTLFAGLLSGCSGGGESASSSDPDSSGVSSSQEEETEPIELASVTDPYLSTAGVAGDAVVAAAGEYEILAADYLYWLNRAAESYLEQLSAFGATELPWDTELEDGSTLADAVKQTALETAALFRLIPELAAEEGLAVPPEVQEEIDGLLDTLAADEQTGTYLLWFQMMNADLYNRVYQESELYSQLQDLYYGEDSEGYPTDAEVLAYAQDEMGVYRAKHILLLTVDSETQEPLDEEEIAEKRARIDDMLAQLRAAEDPIALFDQLMNEYSEDGRDADGNLGYPDGYTTVKGQMVAEFENAALALKDGEISDVVESEFGYHIILRLPLDPADYRESMVAGLMEERASQWMADNPLETRESYEQIDPVQYQDRVTALRNAIAEALNAAEEDEAEEGDGSAASSQS